MSIKQADEASTEYLAQPLEQALTELQEEQHPCIKGLLKESGQNDIQGIINKHGEFFALTPSEAMAAIITLYDSLIIEMIKNLSSLKEATLIENLLGSIALSTVNPCEKGKLIEIKIEGKSKKIDAQECLWIVRLLADSQLKQPKMTGTMAFSNIHLHVERVYVISIEGQDDDEKGRKRELWRAVNLITEQIGMSELTCPDEKDDWDNFVKYCEDLSAYIANNNPTPEHFAFVIDNQPLREQILEHLEQAKMFQLSRLEKAHTPLRVPHKQLEQWLAKHLYPLNEAVANLENKTLEKENELLAILEQVNSLSQDQTTLPVAEKNTLLARAKSIYDFLDKSSSLTTKIMKAYAAIESLL